MGLRQTLGVRLIFGETYLAGWETQRSSYFSGSGHPFQCLDFRKNCPFGALTSSCLCYIMLYFNMETLGALVTIENYICLT